MRQLAVLTRPEHFELGRNRALCRMVGKGLDPRHEIVQHSIGAVRAVRTLCTRRPRQIAWRSASAPVPNRIAARIRAIASGFLPDPFRQPFNRRSAPRGHVLSAERNQFEQSERFLHRVVTGGVLQYGFRFAILSYHERGRTLPQFAQDRRTWL